MKPRRFEGSGEYHVLRISASRNTRFTDAPTLYYVCSDDGLAIRNTAGYTSLALARREAQAQMMLDRLRSEANTAPV